MTSTWRPELVLCNVSMATVAFAELRRRRLVRRIRRRLPARARPPPSHAARRPHRPRHAPALGRARPRGHRHRGRRGLARVASGGPAELPSSRVPRRDLPGRGRRARRSDGCRGALRRTGTGPRGRRMLRSAVRRRRRSRPSGGARVPRVRHDLRSGDGVGGRPPGGSSERRDPGRPLGTTAGAATTRTPCGPSMAAGCSPSSCPTQPATLSGRRSRT